MSGLENPAHSRSYRVDIVHNDNINNKRNNGRQILFHVFTNLNYDFPKEVELVKKGPSEKIKVTIKVPISIILSKKPEIKNEFTSRANISFFFSTNSFFSRSILDQTNFRTDPLRLKARRK